MDAAESGRDQPTQASGGPPKRPVRLPPKPSVNPRRVRGGVRLRAHDAHRVTNWIYERLFRIVEQAATGPALAEGLDYAQSGQTRKLSIESGRVLASVQGRLPRAYLTELHLPHFSAQQRDEILRAMAEQALYAAKLLAGEMPSSIEDVFAPLGLKLFPSEPADIQTRCTCREDKPWCKHVVCTAVLLADLLCLEPLLIFELRGIPHDSFSAMLRDRRALTSQGPGPAIIYQPQIPGVSDQPIPSLDAQIDRFWEAGQELDAIDAPLSRPDVSHVLLKRLGPSPFTGPRFPLLGLLATCYEIISQSAQQPSAAEEPDAASQPPDDTPVD
ncbi:MAG: SWIM zinc finger family protein [Phycisphaerales bacterium]